MILKNEDLMNKRKALPKKIRFEIFKRDSFTCQYCGKSAPEVILHVDHIVPISKGGEDEITNLITACQYCNQGKSNIELDDKTVLAKQKQQLDDLQERREQLEMMYEWQQSLIEINQDATDMVCALFSELVQGYSINEDGKNNIKKLINKYGFSEVSESLKVSVNQYLEYSDGKPEQQSVYKAYNYIEKICRIRKKLENKPYLTDLYKIANILKYKFNYYEHWRAMNLLERAHHIGADIDDLEFIARNSNNWSKWKMYMEDYIERNERNNG